MKRNSNRIPKSDDVNSFWNYAMTAEEVAAYLRKKQERRDRDEPLQLITAE